MKSLSGMSKKAHWRKGMEISFAVKVLSIAITDGAWIATAGAGPLSSSSEAVLVQRGQDFAVLQQLSPTGAGGQATNRVTLLENGLHYLDNGEWKASQDIIEAYPDGAVATHGPWKTIFSPDLIADSVFDIQTPEGQRIAGGVRAIQLTDVASGKSVVIATVKKSAPGQIVPPNQVVYASAFDGLDADVLFVWRHNSISQNVILKKRPVLPDGMDPATTRLEVVSELVEAPVPVLNSATLTVADKLALRDDVTIGFGSLLALRGKAFTVSGGGGLVLGGQQETENPVYVAKHFYQLDDGRRFVIESVSWPEIQPFLKDLSTAKVAPAMKSDPHSHLHDPGQNASLERQKRSLCNSRKPPTKAPVSSWTSI